MTGAVKLVVFDCDGTLVDSQHTIIAAMTRTFQATDRTPPSDEAVRRVVGLSLLQAMQQLLPDEAHDTHRTLVDVYRHAFNDLYATGQVAHEVLYPGIADTLATLADAGYLMGVATGKGINGLRKTLARHDLERYFVTLQTADRHPSKPHPAMLEAAMAEAGAVPGDTLLIGDTSYDIVMARAVGAHALGVAWGYHPAEELHRAGAHNVVHDAGDLVPAIKGITDPMIET